MSVILRRNEVTFTKKELINLARKAFAEAIGENSIHGDPNLNGIRWAQDSETLTVSFHSELVFPDLTK